jgi:4-hydroxyphenylpyruvate dioxygenase-like putative hemolysin
MYQKLLTININEMRRMKIFIDRCTIMHIFLATFIEKVFFSTIHKKVLEIINSVRKRYNTYC